MPICRDCGFNTVSQDLWFQHLCPERARALGLSTTVGPITTADVLGEKPFQKVEEVEVAPQVVEPVTELVQIEEPEEQSNVEAQAEADEAQEAAQAEVVEQPEPTQPTESENTDHV